MEVCVPLQHPSNVSEDELKTLGSAACCLVKPSKPTQRLQQNVQQRKPTPELAVFIKLHCMHLHDSWCQIDSASANTCCQLLAILVDASFGSPIFQAASVAVSPIGEGSRQSAVLFHLLHHLRDCDCRTSFFAWAWRRGFNPNTCLSTGEGLQSFDLFPQLFISNLLLRI